MLKRSLHKLNEKLSLPLLLKVICVLLILWLLKMTNTVWSSWLQTLISIFQPFLIGFVLAYIISPLVDFLERKGIPKNIAILVFWMVLVVAIVALFIVLMPILYEKIVDFLNSMVKGVYWINLKVSELTNGQEIALLENVIDTLVKSLQSYDTWLPNFVSTIPGFMNTFLNILTTTLFSVIISIYVLFDFTKIKTRIKKMFDHFSPESSLYLTAVNGEVSVYIRSLLVIMLIKFAEYGLFYYLVGHQDWMIIAALTSLGVFIPYLGGTIANAIGILTALSLSPFRIACLLIGIVVLSNVDAYVISPMVHKKRSALGPLVTLFAIFAGGVVAGAIGIMISVPLAIAIRTWYQIYMEKKGSKENQSKESIESV